MILAVLLLILTYCSTSCSYEITHGVGSGEATQSTVVIWSRTSGSGAYMHVKVTPAQGGESRAFRSPKKTSIDSDYTMRLEATGLVPATEYDYVVCFDAEETSTCEHSDSFEGHFVTAAEADDPSSIKIVWGGDLAGQNVCRDVERGFPIFKPMSKENATIIVLSGDMIYADGVCEETGLYGNRQVVGDFNLSATLKDFRAHWAYNRADQDYVNFLAGAQALVSWDDHEIVNDAGPSHDERPNRAAGDMDPMPPYMPGQKLTPLALQTMYEWNPFNATTERPRHYGSFRYGKHAEIFRLDTRLYRDANLLNDSEFFPKTMLGLEQKMWFQQAIKESDATWKIIQSSVPISIPTGSIKFGRDGWSNGDDTTDGPNSATEGGFERELMDIIDSFKRSNSKNILWITADVHFAAVFQYDWAPNFWEAVVGPLNAGLFPKDEFDQKLGGVKRRFGPFGPADFEEGLDLGYDGILKFLNYGTVEIEDDGKLTLSIKDVSGDVVYSKNLVPVQ